MPQKKHRFITRWFSRRIDLGTVLAGFLFIFIWGFPPAQHVRSVVLEKNHLHIQNTDFSLHMLPVYKRPDLMFRPSAHHFTPLQSGGDVAATVPVFPYSTAISFSVAEPEGMGQLADLSAAIARPDAMAWIYPHNGLENGIVSTNQSTKLMVQTSSGLGKSRLKQDLSIWDTLLEKESAWSFSFWIGFDPDARSCMVFAEQGTGDVKKDLRLLRIVKRYHVWDSPSGRGLVWLSYRP